MTDARGLYFTWQTPARSAVERSIGKLEDGLQDISQKHMLTSTQYIQDTKQDMLRLSALRATATAVMIFSGVVLASAAPPAQASYELVESFGGLGGGASGVAVDYSSGRVYVADGFHSRVAIFDVAGTFLGAWGWNVIATGAGKLGTNQVQNITVTATAGKFYLEFLGGKGQIGQEHSTTKSLGSSATDEEVKAALEELSNIKEEGGKVEVKGGPGDATGSKPYQITFTGGLGDEKQAFITGQNESLVGGLPSSSITGNLLTKGASAFEICALENEDKCREGHPIFSTSGENIGAFIRPQGIAVDNSCRLHKPEPLVGSECKAFDPFDEDVYVLDTARKEGVVQVFSPGGVFVTSFGVRGTGSPELIDLPEAGGIAVDSSGSGNVYVADAEGKGRVMVFRPASSTEYVYAGQSSDFAVDDGPEKLAVDGVGNVFASSEKFVYKFPLGDLQGPPEWEREDNHSIDGLAVNPVNDDSFYYTQSNNEYHELNGLGTTELSHWKGIKGEKETAGLAFNPFVRWEKEVGVVRPFGLLYAVDEVLGEGFIFSQPEVEPPSVGSEFVRGDRVGSGFAVLEGLVDPHGFDTSYRFEYGPEECATLEQNCILTPVRDLGSANGSVVAAETVTGLAPGTKYYFRVLPSSHCNTEEVLEECVPLGGVSFGSFSTFTSGGGLLDGRVYELVSPPVKNGSEVLPLNPGADNCFECIPGIDDTHFPMQSSPDGGSVVYESNGPFTATGASVNENEYLSRRNAGGGWSGPGDPVGLTPASALRNVAVLQGYKVFSSDLSHGVLYERVPSLAPLIAPEVDGYPNLYLTDTSTPGAEPRPLVTSKPPTQTPSSFALTFAGASPGLNDIIFSANDALKTTGGPNPGYGLYEWRNGDLSTVNVLPGGEVGEPEAIFGSGKELSTGDPDFSHAISTDGTRVFWTGEKGGRRVFVRENGTTTLEIADPSGNGAFLTASATGSKVLLSDGHLFNIDIEDPVTKAPLEEADLDEGQQHFDGILGASEDLSTIYYVDSAVLTPGEKNGEEAEAQAGEPNLYVWQSGIPKFIGTLGGSPSDWAPSPSDRTARVTPDGRYVAFMSQKSLTPYDNIDAVTGSHDNEVYEYDASTGRLVCSSCNPTGGRPIGSSNLNLIKQGSGSGFLPQPQNLAPNGRLFFDSYDALSVQDTNNGFEDVYEYEPAGLGTCVTKPGCVSLISSGQEETNSSFLDATPSGNDAFFTTRSPLLPEDQDDLIDLYDARVNGTPPRSPRPEDCSSGEECRSTIPTPPVLVTPLSGALSGNGNIVPPSSSPPSPPPPPKIPTRAEKLAKALKTCQKLKAKKKRTVCVTRARKQYGAKTAAKKSGRRATVTKAVGKRGR